MFETKEEISHNTAGMFSAPEAKILVVDDNLINREIALGILELYNVQLYEADGGASAIAQAEETNFDIIFMDHMMPEMDGVEAARIIREGSGSNGAGPVIIALTANSSDETKNLFLANGFQDFLSKPIDKGLLHEVMSKWIAPEKKKPAEAAECPAQAAGEPRNSSSEKDWNIHNSFSEHDLKLVRLFYMDGIKKCRLIDELLKDGDYKNYQIEVHGLKSAAANLGAMELSLKARELESAAAREDTGFITAHTPSLISTYKELLAEMKLILEKHEASGHTADAPPANSITDAALADSLSEALSLLEDFQRNACRAKLEELLSYRLDSSMAKALSDVCAKLSMYADDEAEDLLGNIISELRKA